MKRKRINRLIRINKWHVRITELKRIKRIYLLRKENKKIETMRNNLLWDSFYLINF